MALNKAEIKNAVLVKEKDENEKHTNYNSDDYKKINNTSIISYQI